MKDYNAMLNELYANLPKKKTKKLDRIEVPEVDIFVEGRNTTVWKNFGKIADILRRDREWMAKYFSREFGAPVDIEGDRLIIQRRLLPKIVQKKLELFIKEYVQCHECGKLDTHIAVVEGYKMLICEACGARRVIK